MARVLRSRPLLQQDAEKSSVRSSPRRETLTFFSLQCDEDPVDEHVCKQQRSESAKEIHLVNLFLPHAHTHTLAHTRLLLLGLAAPH